jgi:GNAT superfamily N-acetyltransferase
MPGADTGDGAVAQLGERLVRNEEVRGSIPLSSTTIPGFALNPLSIFIRPCIVRDVRVGTPRGEALAGRSTADDIPESVAAFASERFADRCREGHKWMQTQQLSGRYEVSTDPHRLDVDVIHTFLTEDSYWSPGIPRATVERAIRNSLCFGVYHTTGQIGFARIVTDKATFALLADVFILEPHRGKGLSKGLMRCVMEHEDLQGLRRWLLLTSDAHDLYRQFGFEDLANTWRFMEILRADIYQSP